MIAGLAYLARMVGVLGAHYLTGDFFDVFPRQTFEVSSDCSPDCPFAGLSSLDNSAPCMIRLTNDKLYTVCKCPVTWIIGPTAVALRSSGCPFECR